MSASKQFLISFLICLAVFSAIGFSVYRYFDNLFMTRTAVELPEDTEKESEKEEDKTANAEVTDTEKGKPRFVSALVIGKDLTENLPDALMILKADRQTKKLMIASIPADTEYTITGTDSEGNDHNVSISFRDAYKHYGVDYLVDKLYALTNVKIDYYAVVSTSAAQTIFNLVCGTDGMEYTVPEKMEYEDGIANIKLAEGKQSLNGVKAVQLLRYVTYQNGAGDIKRRATQMDFVEKLTKSELNGNNTYKEKLANESERKKILSYVVTNATSDNLYENLDLIFSLGSYEIVTQPFRYSTIIKPENVSTMHSDFALPFKN